MTRFITNKALWQRFQTTFDLHAMTVDPFKANGAFRGSPPLDLQKILPYWSLQTVIDFRVVWNDNLIDLWCKTPVINSGWLLDFSPSVYSCQAEPSSFPCYLFVEQKIRTYFLGRLLNIHFFHHLYCFLKKIHPKRFIIIESFQLLRDEWMIPTHLSNCWHRGRVEVFAWKRLTLEWRKQRMKLWNKKSVREMVGWLGWNWWKKYQTNGWNGFFLFFWGGRWFGWLVAWCDSLIHWNKFSCRQKKGEQNRENVLVVVGFEFLYQPASFFVRKKNRTSPLPKIDVCHPQRIKKSSKQQQLWTLRHSKTLWSLHPIVLGETRVFSKQI